MKNLIFRCITALRGTRKLDVYPILSRFLRSVRLVLHPKSVVFTNTLNFDFLR